MSTEPYYTIPELAPITGFPKHFIRAACNRGAAYHPLPHIRSGSKRPVLRICMTDWVNWLEEEKAY